MDVARGVIPANVKSFNELHDHVDANEYGGSGFLSHLLAPDDLLAEPLLLGILNEIQVAVDVWIKEGDLSQGRSLRPCFHQTSDRFAFTIAASVLDATPERKYTVVTTNINTRI